MIVSKPSAGGTLFLDCCLSSDANARVGDAICDVDDDVAVVTLLMMANRSKKNRIIVGGKEVEYGSVKSDFL